MMRDGEVDKREIGGGSRVQCLGPDRYEMGKNGGCKPFARLSVKMDGEENIAVFLLRTTGYNSIKSLPARLAYYLEL